METSIEWSEDSTKVLEIIYSAPGFDSKIIDKIFGLGLNGVRYGAWDHILSGYVDTSTLTCASTNLKRFGKVVVLEIKATTSMKNENNSACQVYKSNENKTFTIY